MWVVTAGHYGEKYFIRYGSKYNNQGQVILVKRSIVHPKWGASKKEHPFDYDYQLLELQKPITFSLNAQPIKIAHIENMVIDTVITVTGWGHTTENGRYSDVLRAIRIPIISKENCQKVRFPYFRGQLTARMFCAGFPDGKQDACQGDSGGPAVANGRLLGMVSFGYGCATPGSYGVYSKLALVRVCIIGGYNIKISDAPYHLSYGGVCGAVLIHKIWALTTAHCGTNHSYLRIGSTWRLQGAIIRIQYHLIHPSYQLAHEFDYDVQLLKLWRALKFSKMVKPVHIGRTFKNGLYISGWGYTREKGEYEDALQQVNIHVISIEICQEIDRFWFNQTLTDRMFCAGDLEHDACQGDSGGGAVSENRKLIGLSSFGFGCGRGLPGVYTNLSNINIRKWVRQYAGV